jgi:uncharacterized protein
MPITDDTALREIVARLGRSMMGDRDRFRVLETHISLVLLAGRYAYKFKRPLKFGFLDFSTLDLRRFYCEEELRLNRRFAPGLYLAVVPVSGSRDAPRLAGDGPVIEHALKMRAFPQSARLDEVLASGDLQAQHLDALGGRIAELHESANVAGPDTLFGSSQTIAAETLANFENLGTKASDQEARIRRIRDWSEATLAKLAPDFLRRKCQSRVRECHGDLHLSNLVLLNDAAIPFDCIEFSEALRWIDVMSEIAFLVMDLNSRHRSDLAIRFLNAYLESSGDYEGLAVLRHYLVYRSLVRAMVASLRLRQTGISEDEQRSSRQKRRRHLALALRYTQPRQPMLVMMHGLSGSGKTHVSGLLAEHLGAVRIRSDVERKRLHGLSTERRVSDRLASDLYSSKASARTYGRLLSLARTGLGAGYAMIVDAAFLREQVRRPFARLAREMGVPFRIVQCQSDTRILKDRIRSRLLNDKGASDATIAVLEKQLATIEAVEDPSGIQLITVDTAEPFGSMEALRLCKRLGCIGNYD